MTLLRRFDCNAGNNEKLSVASGGDSWSAEAIAEHEFKGQLACDLSFKPGGSLV